MDDFPSNAHGRRRDQSERGREPRKPEEEPKAVDKVIVKGKVIRRKKTLGDRFKESFFGGETQGVGNYILFDILIPSLKEVAAQMVNEGIEKVFWQGRERPRSRFSPPPRRTDYGSYSRSSRSDDRWDRDGRREISRRSREQHTFDDIILPTRDEANDVLDAMDDKIDRYKSASVSELFNFLGITPNWADEKWGWTADTFKRAKVVQTRQGYWLDLPPTEPLD